MDELSRRLGDRAFDLPLPPDLTARVERGAGRRRRRHRRIVVGAVAGVVAGTLALNLVSFGDDRGATGLALGQARAVAAVSPAALDRLAAADTEFGLDLLHQLCAAKPNSNVLLSPASIAVALDLAYAGARGQTAAEIGRVLHQPAYGPALVDALATRRQRMAPLAGQLRQRDTVWADQRVRPSKSYLDDVRTAQDVGVRRVDFRDPDNARETINDEVARQTGGLVKELLPPTSVDGDTRLVLADTLHLSARWQTPFDSKDTRPEAFARADGRRVQVPFMSSRQSVHTVQTAGLTAAELPYRGGRLSLLLLLPSDPKAGCATLTSGTLRSVSSKLVKAERIVRLPKLRLDQHPDLDPALRALGMRSPYVPGLADFGGITSSPPLLVKTVQHAAVMRVDEKGTVAGAATGAVVGIVSMPPVISFDRPFALLLRDRGTGEPLFLGWVADPSQK